MSHDLQELIPPSQYQLALQTTSENDSEDDFVATDSSFGLNRRRQQKVLSESSFLSQNSSQKSFENINDNEGKVKTYTLSSGYSSQKTWTNPFSVDLSQSVLDIQRCIDDGLTSPTRNKKKLKPGIRALKEIRKYQESTRLLLRKAPFQRLVREILAACMPSGRGFLMQSGAIRALQHAAECHLVELFELSNLASVHCKRVTIFPRDLRLVSMLNDNYD